MKQSLAPSTTRDAKGRKFISIVETAYNKAKLYDNEAQRVNEAAGLSALVAEFIAKNRISNRYKDEEVESCHKYVSGYTQPKFLAQQIDALRTIFPGLGTTDSGFQAKVECRRIALPEYAEGWFAVPNRIKNREIFGTNYGKALEIVLNALKTVRNGEFGLYHQVNFSPDCLRQKGPTELFWRDLSKMQSDPDILLVPGQWGIRHRGRSARRTHEVLLPNEFCLGAFEIGCMLLTHEERLKSYDDLWVLCSGDEYAPSSDGNFLETPKFDFHLSGVMYFGTDSISIPHGYYGCPSGFLTL